jgi:hypothetical protein
MVLIAVFLLSFLHPGILFPQMANAPAREKPAETSTAPSTMSQETKVVDSA